MDKELRARLQEIYEFGNSVSSSIAISRLGDLLQEPEDPVYCCSVPGHRDGWLSDDEQTFWCPDCEATFDATPKHKVS